MPLRLNRVLVVKLADLGDALLATPAIRALRQTFPLARIDVLSTAVGGSVLELCPDVDRVIRFPKDLFDQPRGLLQPRSTSTIARLAAKLRLGRYDAVVLLHHLTTDFGTKKFRAFCFATGASIRAGLDNGMGRFLTHAAPDLGFGVRTEWEYGLDAVATLGATTSDHQPRILIPRAAAEAADRLLAERGVTGPFAVISPTVGGYSLARAWPTERFAAVAQRLREATQLPIVVTGADTSTVQAASIGDQPDVIDLAGATTIAQLAAVLQRAVLVIAADSGVTHVAAALETPTVAIFGPSNHKAWRPWGAIEQRVGAAMAPDSRAIVLRAGVPCSPCFYTGFTLGRREGCHLKTCLDLLTPEEVVRVACQLLDASR